jgi:hypothetical protein
MKTATIRINLIYGTMNEFCADIFYRGKLLYSFDGKHTGTLANKARLWAIAQGFTHTKITLG